MSLNHANFSGRSYSADSSTFVLAEEERRKCPVPSRPGSATPASHGSSIVISAVASGKSGELNTSREGSPIIPAAKNMGIQGSNQIPAGGGGDAALTKIGGLMQGFRGTQSIVLRGCNYHRMKEQLHKSIDKRGNLVFRKRTKLRVIDCRPLISAKGNVLMGKGHEVIDRLGGSKCTSVEFAGIGNIHAVRESHYMLRRGCYAASQCGSDNNQCLNWNFAIHESKWLQHISSILYAACCSAMNLQNGDPVLVHCSDGWDRTSQVTALALLLIDPFYRTLEGRFLLWYVLL